MPWNPAYRQAGFVAFFLIARLHVELFFGLNGDLTLRGKPPTVHKLISVHNGDLLMHDRLVTSLDRHDVHAIR